MLIVHRRQQGVSLIESMIALLVISIGLLGIAALQITSMKQNASAMNNSKAVWIGYNMADRIRSNFGQFDKYADKATKKGMEDTCGGGCSSSDMVDSDIAGWSTMVLDLPAGRGIITSPTANELLIAVMWDDEGTGHTGTGCTDPTKDLTCYTVTLLK